jgi:hypothetical protein
MSGRPALCARPERKERVARVRTMTVVSPSGSVRRCVAEDRSRPRGAACIDGVPTATAKLGPRTTLPTPPSETRCPR